jgi:hypothetical protein
MTDGYDAAHEQRNWLERLGNKIPGFRGYLEKEMRREVDKIQRDWLAAQIDRARDALGAHIRNWSRRGNLEVLDLAGSADKALDRLANRIRHADYGYSGFFDAVKIREEQLERLYAFDLGFSEAAENLATRIESLPSDATEPALLSLVDAVEEADRKLDERAQVVENITVTGGR